MCAWCRHTRRSFECTHGGVFESTHGLFMFFQRAAIHTNIHHDRQQHHDHNDTHHTTPHGDRDRERQRQTETERQRKKTERDRERETRQDKTRCEQHTSHVTFLVDSQHINVTLTLAQVQGVARTSSHVSAAWCRRCLDTLPLHTPHHLSHLPLHSPDFQLQLPRGPVQGRTPPPPLPLCTPVNEEQSDTYVDTAPLTGYEPNELDSYHISETTEFFINRPLNLHDLDLDDYTIGRALSSPLFTQERQEPTGHRQAYHSLEESLLSSQSSSVGHVRTGRPVSDQFDSLIPNVRDPCRDSENEQIRILLERGKEQILADCRSRDSENTSSLPIMTEEISKN